MSHTDLKEWSQAAQQVLCSSTSLHSQQHLNQTQWSAFYQCTSFRHYCQNSFVLTAKSVFRICEEHLQPAGHQGWMGILLVLLQSSGCSRCEHIVLAVHAIFFSLQTVCWLSVLNLNSFHVSIIQAGGCCLCWLYCLMIPAGYSSCRSRSLSTLSKISFLCCKATGIIGPKLLVTSESFQL